MTIDTMTLTAVINQCFANSSDARFSMQERSNFLADGKRLRGLLVNLISAQFNDGTQQVVDANSELSKVNADLANNATTLANTAARLNDIASLVSNLDALINVATTFI